MSGEKNERVDDLLAIVPTGGTVVPGDSMRGQEFILPGAEGLETARAPKGGVGFYNPDGHDGGLSALAALRLTTLGKLGPLIPVDSGSVTPGVSFVEGNPEVPPSGVFWTPDLLVITAVRQAYMDLAQGPAVSGVRSVDGIRFVSGGFGPIEDEFDLTPLPSAVFEGPRTVPSPAPDFDPASGVCDLDAEFGLIGQRTVVDLRSGGGAEE